MQLEIKKPNIVAIEIMAWMIKGSLNANNPELATKQMDELISLIEGEKRLKGEWQELLFTIANKF